MDVTSLYSETMLLRKKNFIRDRKKTIFRRESSFLVCQDMILGEPFNDADFFAL